MPQEPSRRVSSELFNRENEPVILVPKNENVGSINLPLISNSIRIDCSKIRINNLRGRTIPQTPILLWIDDHFPSLASIFDLSFLSEFGVICISRRDERPRSDHVTSRASNKFSSADSNHLL